ncbi:uncharacterized protein LOC108048325 [Drosophila rhopaloa]|uniref:Uncharacterized protein LOC108048325 n=1 Tax=Drosophila rhopaloa TaxID=1041015 RepID=A0A6P4FFS6_DRORH|nr:uncharacterized protein LOC108048325 [Drosophila rhopaloa]
MEYQECLRNKLTYFHYHLHSDFGVVIKVATCIAFGAVCGWIMSLLTFIVYKVALRLGVKPNPNYHDADDDLDLDADNGYDLMLPESQEFGDWLVGMRRQHL